MTSIKIIENKISFIEKQLNILKFFKKYPSNILENDMIVRGAAERYIYLAVQASIDLAEVIIAFKDFRKPTTYRENFEILEEHKFIQPKLRESMIQMTGFRNRIAHGYENIDYKTVTDILLTGPADIRSLIRLVKKRLKLN